MAGANFARVVVISALFALMLLGTYIAFQARSLNSGPPTASDSIRIARLDTQLFGSMSRLLTIKYVYRDVQSYIYLRDLLSRDSADARLRSSGWHPIGRSKLASSWTQSLGTRRNFLFLAPARNMLLIGYSTTDSETQRDYVNGRFRHLFEKITRSLK